jgi:hypothetical protein
VSNDADLPPGKVVKDYKHERNCNLSQLISVERIHHTSPSITRLHELRVRSFNATPSSANNAFPA